MSITQSLLATARHIIEHGSDNDHYITDGDLDELEAYFDAVGNHDAALIVNAAFRMKGVYDFQVKTTDDQYVAVAALVLVAAGYADMPRPDREPEAQADFDERFARNCAQRRATECRTH